MGFSTSARRVPTLVSAEPTKKTGQVLHDPTAKDIEHGMRAAFPAPIYRSGPDQYEIDNCEPQAQAMREGKIEVHALSKGHYPGRRMNSNELPGLASAGFWNCREMQDWGLNLHRNEGLEIVFLETGGMAFTVDGKVHSLHAGDLTLTRPWQLHKLGDPNIGRGRLYWLILDVGVRRPNQEWVWPPWVMLSPHDLGELTRKLRHGDRAVWSANSRIREIFRDLGNSIVRWREPRACSRLIVTINRLLVELLEILAEQQVTESPELATRSRTVELFLKDLAENPASSAEPWTLKSMAAHCGVGITSMAKYCSSMVNNGPMAYLGLCRLEHAAKALRDHPELSVTDIALSSGINSSQYFATLFRSHFKLTPTDYRARWLAKASRPGKMSRG